MKVSPLFKILLMIALAAWMHLLANPAQANVSALAESGAANAAQTVKPMGVPETSSVVLIGAVGLMLMLRRRRLHA